LTERTEARGKLSDWHSGSAHFEFASTSYSQKIFIIFLIFTSVVVTWLITMRADGAGGGGTKLTMGIRNSILRPENAGFSFFYLYTAKIIVLKIFIFFICRSSIQ
jgi:hypothetical protein